MLHVVWSRGVPEMVIKSRVHSDAGALKAGQYVDERRRTITIHHNQGK